MRQDNNSLAHTTWNCKYHVDTVGRNQQMKPHH